MSPEEVALELAKIISGNEYAKTKVKTDEMRAYWLDLYRSCLAAVKTKEA